MQVDDLRLLDIPRSWQTVAIANPKHGACSKDCPGLSTEVVKLVERTSVARVWPKISKGITDLLLPQTSFC